MKRIVILGSTGSIGTQTLDVVRAYPQKINVVAMSVHSNIELLKRQIDEFNPEIVGVADEEKAEELRRQVDIPVISGDDASLKLAGLDNYDTLVNSLVSLSGIKVTLEAIKKGKNIALANKEALVSAGEIVMREVKKHGTNLMPIDSEHSALYQCLNGERKEDIHKMIITCSGGALRDKTFEELQYVTVEQALGHKTWNMGHKITIDCATLMNKGFEVIEAMWLYDLPVDKIDVVIHPQSLIHSMIEYSDGSIMAQISKPNMKLPIQYALSFPERWDSPIERFKFDQNMTFGRPDLDRFPCLGYALESAKKLGTLPAAMNAANDYMVGQFLARKCKFLDIARVIRGVMDRHHNTLAPSLDDIDDAIKKSTERAKCLLQPLS